MYQRFILPTQRYVSAEYNAVYTTARCPSVRLSQDVDWVDEHRPQPLWLISYPDITLQYYNLLRFFVYKYTTTSSSVQLCFKIIHNVMILPKFICREDSNVLIVLADRHTTQFGKPNFRKSCLTGDFWSLRLFPLVICVLPMAMVAATHAWYFPVISLYVSIISPIHIHL